MFSPVHQDLVEPSKRTLSDVVYMLGPVVLRFWICINVVDLMFGHVCQTVGYPVNVLLNVENDVAENRWAAWTCDHEQVRKP